MRKCLVEVIQCTQVTFPGPLHGHLDRSRTIARSDHEIHFPCAPPVEDVPVTFLEFNEGGAFKRLARIRTGTGYRNTPQRGIDRVSNKLDNT